MNSNILPSIITMAGLGAGFAILLSIAYQYFKVKEDPNVKKIEELLPSLNCGACTFTSCHAYAEHAVKEKDLSPPCKVIEEEKLKQISNILGIDIKTKTSFKALVHCGGSNDKIKILAQYEGIQSCKAAQLIKEGFMECKYGCLGLGDCARVCPVDAIEIKNGLAKIDMDKCIGCGKCVKACPKYIISLEENFDNNIIKIACNSKDNGKKTRQSCKVGCIACKICEKKGPDKVFEIKNNLSTIDYKKYKNFKEYSEVIKSCPTNCIITENIQGDNN